MEPSCRRRPFVRVPIDAFKLPIVDSSGAAIAFVQSEAMYSPAQLEANRSGGVRLQRVVTRRQMLWSRIPRIRLVE